MPTSMLMLTATRRFRFVEIQVSSYISSMTQSKETTTEMAFGLAKLRAKPELHSEGCGHVRIGESFAS